MQLKYRILVLLNNIQYFISFWIGSIFYF